MALWCCSPRVVKARRAACCQSASVRRSSVVSSALRTAARIRPWRWKGHRTEGVLADEGALGQPQGGAFVGEPDGAGGEGDVEGVQQAHRAQDVAFVGGEVGQGAGDQGGEVVVEVAGLRGVAAAAQFEEPGDGQVERGRPCERAVMTCRMGSLMRGWPSQVKRRAR